MGKLRLTESQLINLIRKALISEQSDVTDIKTYPACVQKFGSPTTQTGKQYSIEGSGYFKGYIFYNNGRVKKPDSNMANYSCDGDTILIDGAKNVQDPSSYPSCVTKAFGYKVQNYKNIYYIDGLGNFDDWNFYNNYKVWNTKEQKMYQYSCGQSGIIIGEPPSAGANIASAAIAAVSEKGVKSCASKEKGYVHYDNFSQANPGPGYLIPFGNGDEIGGLYDSGKIFFYPKKQAKATYEATAKCVDGELEIGEWQLKT